ncbi:hypothetical protein DESA109040_20290 [Deinococcus saxicola]
MGLLRVDQTKVDQKFILYAYLGPDFQNTIKERTIPGSTVDRLPINSFDKFPIRVPSLPIQRQIAAVLSAFDDKIELNQQMNRTLEQMARALFKSWFVDFDPVRAKMRGEMPEGMDAEMAALFPDRVMEVEGREIPVGWRWGTVGDIAIQAKDQITPLSQPEASFAHFSIPAFDAKNQPTIEKGSEIKSNKFLVPDRAILVSKLNPSTPRIWNVVRDDGVDFNVCSTEFIPLVASQAVFDSLLHATLNDENFSRALTGQASGTSNSHQRVKPADILNVPLLMPSKTVIIEFDSLTAPIIEQVKENLRKSAQLAQLRDALLPRLLSGEVDVGGWEEQ